MFIGYKDGSIIFGGTTNQPHDNLVITLDEMEQLAAFYQHEQDKTAVKEYLKTAINILGSAEISTELAKKYLYDAGLLDQLVEESNHSQENFGDNFLTSIAKGIEALEKRLDVKEWEGLPEPVANRMAHEFIAERNPCRWTGSGDAPDDVGFEPLNFPIDDIYPKGDKPVLRMQLIGTTFPKRHYVYLKRRKIMSPTNDMKARLFVDMDGTLAVWKQAACFEDLLQPGYFRDLPPYQTVLDAVKILCNTKPELDVYALSAYMPENPYAVHEKNAWLDAYLPEIDSEHRIFVACGSSKARAAANRLKTPCIDSFFVLLDDYSVNLHEWKANRGSCIKLRNGINGNGGTWKGESVTRFDAAENIADRIWSIIKKQMQ